MTWGCLSQRSNRATSDNLIGRRTILVLSQAVRAIGCFSPRRGLLPLWHSAHGSVRLNAAATDLLRHHRPARLETALGPPSNKEGGRAIRTAVRPPGCFAVQVLCTRCGWLSINILWLAWASDLCPPHVFANA